MAELTKPSRSSCSRRFAGTSGRGGGTTRIDIDSLSQASPEQISWLSGLLEGEGWFGWRTYKRQGYKWYAAAVQLGMTDEDVIKRAAALCDSTYYVKPESPPRKQGWAYTVTGVRALTIMLAVFPYLGERRSEKIKWILDQWEHN